MLCISFVEIIYDNKTIYILDWDDYTWNFARNIPLHLVCVVDATAYIDIFSRILVENFAMFAKLVH